MIDRRLSLYLICSIALVILAVGCTYDGRSAAINSTVADGQIVLVKKGQTLGAFILRDQKMEPEGLKYDWYYRTDGKGSFKAVESKDFHKGKGTLSKKDISSRPYKAIEFGPFSIGWSGNETGKGFIYYDHFAGDSLDSNDMGICVTQETDIEAINAADSKWIYKRSPSDKGF